MTDNQELKHAVKSYWENHPLGSLDIDQLGNRDYFERHEAIYRDQVTYAVHLFQFDQHKGELGLDVGCGPGWVVRNYARGGAKIIGVDLTEAGVQLAHKSFDLFQLDAQVSVGDAEQLPFHSNTFDFVSSNGVLHHTPNTEDAFQEIWRVLKLGVSAIISLSGSILRDNDLPATSKTQLRGA